MNESNVLFTMSILINAAFSIPDHEGRINDFAEAMDLRESADYGSAYTDDPSSFPNQSDLFDFLPKKFCSTYLRCIS